MPGRALTPVLSPGLYTLGIGGTSTPGPSLGFMIKSGPGSDQGTLCGAVESNWGQLHAKQVSGPLCCPSTPNLSIFGNKIFGGAGGIVQRGGHLLCIWST